MDSFWFNSFFTIEKPLLFRAYSRLLYDVFVGEQGWDLPADHLAGELLPSYYDTKAIVSVARNHWGTVVGGVRCSLPGEAIPHEHLFTSHLLHPAFNRYRKSLSSLNALAVAKPYRQSKFKYGNKSFSLAKYVLDESMQRGLDAGAKVFVATTGAIEAAKLLRSLDFFVLDGVDYQLEPFSGLMNMVYLGDVSSELIEYVKGREQKTLNELGFDTYIQMHLKSLQNLPQNQVYRSQYF